MSFSFFPYHIYVHQLNDSQHCCGNFHYDHHMHIWPTWPSSQMPMSCCFQPVVSCEIQDDFVNGTTEPYQMVCINIFLTNTYHLYHWPRINFTKEQHFRCVCCATEHKLLHLNKYRNIIRNMTMDFLKLQVLQNDSPRGKQNCAREVQ